MATFGWLGDLNKPEMEALVEAARYADNGRDDEPINLLLRSAVAKLEQRLKSGDMRD